MGEEKKRRRLSLFRGDRSLWIMIATLCVISLLVVYSSTASMAYRNVAGDTSFYLSRQARFIVLGFILIWIIHWIDIKYYIRFAPGLLKLAVLLMLLTYFLGETRNDASRWIRIPIIGLTFQPSDAIKVALMMTLASALGKRQSIIDRIPILPSFSQRDWKNNPHKNFDILRHSTKVIIFPILLSCAVIFPSNLSTAAILFICSVFILWVGRVRIGQIWKLVWSVGLIGIILIGGMYVMGVGRAKTWVNRIESHILPSNISESFKEEAVDFQEAQAKIAIASGGIAGKGPGNSTQRSQLPHPYSDFAFAFIIEEYGLIGAMIVMMIYLWIFYRARVIVYQTTSPVAGLLVLGLTMITTFTAFIHIFVSVGIIPITGQPLPIISLGGSSVLFNCISFGIILSVSRQCQEEQEQQRRLAAKVKREAQLAQQDLLLQQQQETQNVQDWQQGQQAIQYTSDQTIENDDMVEVKQTPNVVSLD